MRECDHQAGLVTYSSLAETSNRPTNRSSSHLKIGAHAKCVICRESRFSSNVYICFIPFSTQSNSTWTKIKHVHPTMLSSISLSRLTNPNIHSYCTNITTSIQARRAIIPPPPTMSIVFRAKCAANPNPWSMSYTNATICLMLYPPLAKYILYSSQKCIIHRNCPSFPCRSIHSSISYT